MQVQSSCVNEEISARDMSGAVTVVSVDLSNIDQGQYYLMHIRERRLLPLSRPGIFFTLGYACADYEMCYLPLARG